MPQTHLLPSFKLAKSDILFKADSAPEGMLSPLSRGVYEYRDRYNVIAAIETYSPKAKEARERMRYQEVYDMVTGMEMKAAEMQWLEFEAEVSRVEERQILVGKGSVRNNYGPRPPGLVGKGNGTVEDEMRVERRVLS